MAASAACSNPHVFAHTLRFSARGFLALTKNAWFLEVPSIMGWPAGHQIWHNAAHVLFRMARNASTKSCVVVLTVTDPHPSFWALCLPHLEIICS